MRAETAICSRICSLWTFQPGQFNWQVPVGFPRFGDKQFYQLMYVVQ